MGPRRRHRRRHRRGRPAAGVRRRLPGFQRSGAAGRLVAAERVGAGPGDRGRAGAGASRHAVGAQPGHRRPVRSAAAAGQRTRFASFGHMPLRNGEHGYGGVTKFLHWLTVAAIVGQFTVGWTMEADDEALDREKDRIDALEDAGKDQAKESGRRRRRRVQGRDRPPGGPAGRP